MQYSVHTAVFKMDNKQGPIVENTKFCSMLHGSLDRTGVWGRMDMCKRVAESLCCSSETITALFVNWLYSNTR